MVDGFARYDGHMSTGIQTSHRLMLELTRNGYNNEAYRLLNLRTCPSWGFMLEQGATTIWERWDGYVAGQGFQEPSMNSFNHWALGSVGEWIWRSHRRDQSGRIKSWLQAFHDRATAGRGYHLGPRPIRFHPRPDRQRLAYRGWIISIGRDRTRKHDGHSACAGK